MEAEVHVRRSRGFTLIELLVMLVIIGVFAIIGVRSYLDGFRAGLVRQVTSQLAADLNQARSSVLRYNGDATVSFTDGGTSYTVQFAGPSTTPITRPLPAGLKLSAYTLSSGTKAPTTITYQAPNAEVGDLVGLSFGAVVSSSSTSFTQTVRTLGLTGKVYVR